MTAGAALRHAVDTIKGQQAVPPMPAAVEANTGNVKRLRPTQWATYKGQSWYEARKIQKRGGKLVSINSHRRRA